jgi:exopolysaccharide biosynthesis predicted pyruvyltransferase EpsI
LDADNKGADIAMREIHISFSQRFGTLGAVNELLVQSQLLGQKKSTQFVLNYEHVGDDYLRDPIVLDGYIFGVLLFAMKRASKLFVHGSVSDTAIRNAWQFGEAWRSWAPEKYQPVEIIADEVVGEEYVRAKLKDLPSRGYLSAYSGGVDSTFTVLRNSTQMLGTASTPLGGLVMVHGFDVGLDNTEDFLELTKRTKPFIESMDLPIHIVRTNSKMVQLQNWNHSFGGQLSCVLHQFSTRFMGALLPSGSNDFLKPKVAWGSTSSTDHLLSGGLFRIIQDGCGWSRTDKVKVISQHATATRCLKVCWAGVNQGSNCGVCEKCLRTKLNFLAVGNPNPQCFDSPISERDVLKIRSRNEPQLNELIDVINYERLTHESDDIFNALKKTIEIKQLTQNTTIWSGGSETTAPTNFLNRLQVFQKTLCQYLLENQPLTLLTKIPGNRGDHLIWLGTEKLLAPVSHVMSRLSWNDLCAQDTPKHAGTLIVPGSGAMTKLWHEWLPKAIAIAATKFDRVVILPSEYDSSVLQVRNVLKLPNVIAFAREAESFGAIKEFGQAGIGADPALYAFNFLPSSRNTQSDDDLGKVLLALRTDRSSVLLEHGICPAKMNDDISLSAKSLNEFLGVIHLADSIVTDRLHVAVSGIMLGKNVRYFDPFNQKITRYAEFNFQSDFENRLQLRSATWLRQNGYAIEVN